MVKERDTDIKPYDKSLTIDVDYYQDLIDDPEVSDERKRELIEIIGVYVIQFIDMGYGIHPVQSALNEKQMSNTDQDEKEHILERSKT